VRRISLLFFTRFEANLSEYGSYSLHIRMFRYIRKHHLFVSFASYLLQNIRFEANIRKSLSEFHNQANIRLKIFTFKQIFAGKYSHISDFSRRIASDYKGKPFTILDLNYSL
jgi:hypothetical protein